MRRSTSGTQIRFSARLVPGFLFFPLQTTLLYNITIKFLRTEYAFHIEEQTSPSFKKLFTQPLTTEAKHLVVTEIHFHKCILK